MNDKTKADRSKKANVSIVTSPVSSSSGDVFIKVALEQLINSKEAKKLTALKDAAKTALTALEAATGHPSPSSNTLKTIFAPFQLACQSRQPTLISIAIDCLGKLFPYNYWGKPDDGGDAVDQDSDSMDTNNSPSTENLSNLTAFSGPSTAKNRLSVDSYKSGTSDHGRSPSSSSSPSSEANLIGIVIDTICDSFSSGDNTDEKVQLQIVKSLSAAICTPDPTSSIHGGVLLKAIRTTYNIFLFSKTPNTQIVAQATLAQMVQAIFSRIPEYIPPPPTPLPDISQSNSSESGEKVTENTKGTEETLNKQNSDSKENVSGSTLKESSNEKIDDIHKGEKDDTNKEPQRENEDNVSSPKSPIDTKSSKANSPSKSVNDPSESAPQSPKKEENQNDLGEISSSSRPSSPIRIGPKELLKSESNLPIINLTRDTSFDILFKDAFLVFRALCKLSMKVISTPEGATDIKSPSMRSKLLSLHLIYSTLTSHLRIFTTPAPVLFTPTTPIPETLFIHAIKQFLCLALSRNSSSVVPQVFDVSMEIFGQVLVSLRTMLKKELSVIFTEIILPIIEARNTVTYYQRLSAIRNLIKTLSDPSIDGGRILVELYLNYDCDVEAGAKENIWERLLISVAKITSFHVIDAINSPQVQSTGTTLPQSQSINGLLPAFTTATLNAFTKDQIRELYSASGDFFEMKKRALELLVRGVLRTLLIWIGNQKLAMENEQQKLKKEDLNGLSAGGETNVKESMELKNLDETAEVKPIKRLQDDPLAFEHLKQKKQVISQGVREFNAKPKRGIKYLIESGCILSSSPADIAKFLISVEGIDKKALGEYLGEGDEGNIAIMHAFVDELDFSSLAFVDALRQFLQTFRLPGEAQKIDRFMLKFAERYLTGNPQSFSSADTAYVLAYSVIMLNTDLHNAQVKKKMAKADFIKNNRGIDGGNDLPPEYLESIYDEIIGNEIVMNEEQALKVASQMQGDNSKPKNGLTQITIASEAMAISTEAKFNHLMKGGRKVKKNAGSAESNFYAATHYEHVKAMFQLIWMSVLTSLSGPIQESDDQETVMLSMEGFKCAIRICCMFDMELERQALVSTLAKIGQLARIEDMRTKNIEAIRTLLDIAFVEGNYLAESWNDVVSIISQLERFQLLGSDGENELQRIQRQSTEQQQRNRRESSMSYSKPPEISEASSQGMAIAVDKIFTSTTKLSGQAIVSFVKALCNVSWEEITASSDVEHPKMYSLQRLVEISYYNMRRIRVEWSNIWAVLGEHFNQVGSHPNSVVAFFALDKLRQLAMKFLEIEELPNFKFQKDFLRPFEYVMGNATDVKIKDMVLACLSQMIQAKAKSMKSGWKAIFAAFTKAAKEYSEPISQQSFEIVKSIFKSHFENIVANSSFADFTACLVEFCKNKKFVKTSLQAVEMIKSSIPRMVDYAKGNLENGSANPPVANGSGVGNRKYQDETSNHQQVSSSTPILSTPGGTSKMAPDEDPNFKFWFPILFGLYEIIMTCELEVRTRGLNYLFETLKAYGDTFPKDFWEVVAKGVLFPIFDDLKLSNQEQNKSANREDLSVWMSTTLIQALRQFVDLFSFFFDILQFLLDGALDLLTMCLTQDNETLARIGSTCTHQFIESNASKFDEDTWDKICLMFTQLFEKTTPAELFFDLDESPDDAKRLYENQVIAPVGLGLTEYEALQKKQQESSEVRQKLKIRKKRPEKKDFQKIIMKCVLHLLLIQTVNEILNSTSEQPVYPLVKSRHLFLILDCLERSYIFARDFNGNLDLRTTLYRMGFMKQMPNLLKQETTSVSSFIQVLVRMYSDADHDRIDNRDQIAQRLVPLSYSLLKQYSELDPENKKRDVAAWRPVVLTILGGLAEMDEALFKANVPKFYECIVDLLLQELTPDFKTILHVIFLRVGKSFQVHQADEDSATAIHSTNKAISSSTAPLNSTDDHAPTSSLSPETGNQVDQQASESSRDKDTSHELVETQLDAKSSNSKSISSPKKTPDSNLINKSPAQQTLPSLPSSTTSSPARSNVGSPSIKIQTEFNHPSSLSK